jgi:Flp/Fap pilin component
MNTLKDFLTNETGATAIEYGLIAAGISIAIITVVGRSARACKRPSPALRHRSNNDPRYAGIGAWEAASFGGLSFHIRSLLPRQPSHGPAARNRPLCDVRHIGPRRALASCLHGTPGVPGQA